jgi:pimeloyl-ACP methyl ester carboxylesterase
MRREVAYTSRGPIEYVSVGETWPILCLHGTPGGCDHILLVDDIVKEGFRLISPSRPGYLGTPLDVGRTPREQADAMIALLDELRLTKVAVLAISGAGPIGVELALHHRKRVSALVMMSAANSQRVVPGSRLARAFSLSRLGAWLMGMLAAISPTTAARRLLRGSSTYDPATLREASKQVVRDPAKLSYLRTLVAAMKPFGPRKAGWKNDLRQLSALAPLAFEQLQCPVLVIHGRADARVPFAEAELLAGRAPRAELLAVDASHVIPLSGADRTVNDRMVGFLRMHAR